MNAEETKLKEPVVVNGDQVEYFHEQKKVVGSGNISIDYQGVKMSCDKVTVYLDTKEAVAEGNVKLTQKDGTSFTGERINFNFDRQTGSVIKGHVKATPFYGAADQVEKKGDKEIGLSRGYVTTCDLEQPHYRIQSKKVKIYLGQKVVAYNTFLFVGNVPIMYIPVYAQPIFKVPKAAVTVIPGKSKDWGYYVLTAWRYQLNEKARGDILLDYRSKLGLGEGINHYYSLDRLGSGSAKVYYSRVNDSLAYEPSGAEMNRYRYQLRHRWDMGEGSDTIAIAEFNKLSDKDIIKDFFYKEYEELQDPEDLNYVSFITSKREYTSEFTVRKRFDKFYTVVERLPEFKLDIKNNRISQEYPVYYKGDLSGTYLNKTYAQAIPEQKDVNTGRFDTYHQLSYAGRFFRALNMTPYVGTEQTYYSRNKWGDTNLIRGALKAGVDNSIKFYRVYDVATNAYGLGINQLRHIVTPTASYYFIHQPTISPDNLNQFDSVDALAADNGVRLSLENKLQTKRGSEGDMKSVDLANLIVSTDYGFRLKEGEMGYKSQKFKSVDFQLDFVPYPWLYTLSKMRVNTKRYMIETASIDIAANGGDAWSAGAGYRYEKTEVSFSNLLTGSAMYKINNLWRVRAYGTIDINKGSIDEQEYTVYRDLHCWIAEVTYNIRKLEDQSVWFVLRLKAFPDMPIGFRRTYYRPSFGSTGAN